MNERSKNLIILDKDDTLADTTPAIAQAIMAHCGEYSYEHLISQGRFKREEDAYLWGLRQRFFNTVNDLLSIPPVRTAEQALRMLSQLGISHIVSGRSDETTFFTQLWLVQNGLDAFIPPNHVHQCPDNCDPVRFKVDKVQELIDKIAQETGQVPDCAAIDDDGDIIRAYEQAGIFTFVVNQRWNRGIQEGPLVKKVANVLHAAYYLKSFGSIERFMAFHRQQLAHRRTVVFSPLSANR